MKEKTFYYPIAIKLKGKKVVVIGGGLVAERKIKTLLKFRPDVYVVSPSLTTTLEKLVKSRRIFWIDGKVKNRDINGASLVIAATSDAKINQKIKQWAEKQGVLVNVVDQPQLSDFISPAVFRALKADVAVYTHARDPILSRDLKNFLKENWDVFLSYRHRL